MDLKNYSLEDIDKAVSTLNRKRPSAKNAKLDVILSELNDFREELFFRRDGIYRSVQDMSSADAVKTDKAIHFMKSINRVIERI